MKTTTPRVLALAIWSAVLALCDKGFSQTAVAPATVPTPGAAATGNAVIPPQPPLQPIQTNAPASGAMSASPRAATTFQMQTPGGGAPAQAANIIPPGNRPNITQPTQQTVSPTQGQFGSAVAPTFVPSAVAPGIGFDATSRGLTVNTVEPTGTYFRSGLRPGDVMVSSYGQPIQSEADFQRLTALYPGQPVPVVVMRDGRQQTINLLPQDVVQTSPSNREALPPNAQSQAHLGVRFDIGIPNAAVVASVRPRSPAEVAGLRPGDMITALNGERIASYQDAMQTLGSMRPGDRVDISYSRRVDNQTSAVLDSRPGAAMRTATYPSDIGVEENPAPLAPPVQDRRVLQR
jgi:predicted metalloprotease with PDZ domain